MQILLASSGAAHMHWIARALQDRDSLAGYWTSGKNRHGIRPEKYRRAWIFHLALKPFYQFASAGTIENFNYRLYPLWQFWIRRQQPPPFDVAYGMPCHSTELFDIADRTGAFKLLDATSSHPTSSYGFWQRECDVWNPGFEPRIPRWLFCRYNREIERADLILCPSTFVRDSMLYNGTPEAKCVISPYGVDTSIFKPRTVVPAKPRFICVGGIGLRKGHQYLFRAFAKARETLKDAELVCVGTPFGDGEFDAEWRKWQGTFTHYQGIPVTELAKLLSESTAFVLPSTEEGFAKAVIEGMSSGLPIIATHESGATTLVREGVEGMIVRARDINQLAEAMIKVATNREANEQMGRAAYERGAKGNTWGDFADRLLKICASAVKTKPKP